MNAAVIVAAGKGTRMGPGVDKLFLDLSGRPVVAHTWERLDQSVSVHEIILVIRSGMEEAFQDMASLHGFKKTFRIVPGGAERQDSVWNGLAALSPGTELVAIQDGARPCTPLSVIDQTFQAAAETGAAVAAQAVTDTIKESQDGRMIGRHLDRSRLFSVQTPQTFRVSVIRKALEVVRNKGLQVTDDTAACQWIDQPVRLVLSNLPNPKVTHPSDLPLIEALLSAEGNRS